MSSHITYYHKRKKLKLLVTMRVMISAGNVSYFMTPRHGTQEIDSPQCGIVVALFIHTWMEQAELRWYDSVNGCV